MRFVLRRPSRSGLLSALGGGLLVVALCLAFSSPALAQGGGGGAQTDQVVVPDVNGMSQAGAELALRMAGLFPVGTGVEEPDPRLDGRVVSQDPAAGSLAVRGSGVAFDYGTAPSGPYLSELYGRSATAMSVVWHVSVAEAQDHRVWYRPVGTSSWTEFDLSASGVVRRGGGFMSYARITGLAAGTEYELEYCRTAAECAGGTRHSGAGTVTTAPALAPMPPPNAPARITGQSVRFRIVENVDPADLGGHANAHPADLAANQGARVGWVYGHLGEGDVIGSNEPRFWLTGTGHDKFSIELENPEWFAGSLRRVAVIKATERLTLAPAYRLTVHFSDGRNAAGGADASADDSIDIVIEVLEARSFGTYVAVERPGSPVLTADTIGATSVTLSWPAPDPGNQTIAGYRVQYRVQGDSHWSTSETVTSRSAVIDGLQPETAYEFRGITTTTPIPGTYNPLTWSDKLEAPVITATTTLRQVAVPDVVGQAKAAAEQAITDAGLVAAAATTVTSDRSQDGTAESQSPAAGTVVDGRSTVTVTYYEYQATVPNVVNRNRARAERDITNAGLVAQDAATTMETPDRSLDGKVASQDPAAGARVDDGSTVTVTYYAWNAPIVPDVIGLTKAEAEAALTALGLVPNPEPISSSTIDPNQDNIVHGAVSPQVGTQVEVGTSVLFFYHRYTGPRSTTPGTLPPKKTATTVPPESEPESAAQTAGPEADTDQQTAPTTTATTLPPEPEPEPAPPAAPRQLRGSAGSGSVTLTWTAPNDPSVTGYQILRKVFRTKAPLQVYAADTGSTATSFTDSAVEAGVTYVYRVKAINAAGVGKWSNFVRVASG